MFERSEYFFKRHFLSNSFHSPNPKMSQKQLLLNIKCQKSAKKVSRIIWMAPKMFPINGENLFVFWESSRNFLFSNWFQVRSIDDTSNFDEFPEVDLKIPGADRHCNNNNNQASSSGANNG